MQEIIFKIRYFERGLTKTFKKVNSIRVLGMFYRSSRPDVFCKKGILRNFGKFTGKHKCQSLYLNKVAGQACNFIKIETLTQVFPVNFPKFLRTPFLREHLRWLLLVLTNFGTTMLHENKIRKNKPRKLFAEPKARISKPKFGKFLWSILQHGK